MLPPKIIELAANWSSSRREQLIQCIIAHDTERPSDDSTSIKYLQRGGELPDGSDRKVSIHVLIEPNGDSYVMVHDVLGANHAGYGTLKINGRTYGPTLHYSLNTVSLGFELEHTVGSNDPYPDTQLLSAGYWITTWRERYGTIPLFLHRDVDAARRKDPIHLNIADLELWTRKAQALMSNQPTPDKPVRYTMIVPQAVYTQPDSNSKFAGGSAPIVLVTGQTILIGKVQDTHWLWLANGWGFIPISTAVLA